MCVCVGGGGGRGGKESEMEGGKEGGSEEGKAEQREGREGGRESMKERGSMYMYIQFPVTQFSLSPPLCTSSRLNRTPPTGAPKATDTPAAAAADNTSLFLASLW